MISFKDKNPLAGKSTRWYPKDEMVCIHGRDISHGFIYVGSGLTPNNASDGEVDACLIDPALEAPSPGSKGKVEYMGYWPHYSDIADGCRGQYLDWLAKGCKDPDVNIGYVFLYFYGLERRLLVDDDRTSPEERDQIVAEIIRLMGIYGQYNSFNRYANSLLVAEWLIFRKSKQPPEHIDINNSKSSSPIRIELGLYSFEDKPLPPEAAFRWYVLHPKYKIRTPARRCAEEFDELFKEEYLKAFGDGLYLPKAKKKLKLVLSTASPSIEPIVLKIDLPDCFDNSRALSQIGKIVDKCTEQLEKYSKHLIKSKKKGNSLQELALLPGTIANRNPRAIRVKELLQEKCANELWFPKLKDLYQVVEENPTQDPSKKELTDLFAFLQLLGFGVAPDIRYHSIKLGLDSSVSVFACVGGEYLKPSQEFNVLSSIIRLGAIMSRIDGHIHQNEIKIIKDLVKKDLAITELERQYIDSFLYWCFHAEEEDALSANGIKPYLEKLPAKYRRHIADLLIRIIYADGQIKTEEIKKLEKFYPTLGLDVTKIPDDVYRVYSNAHGLDNSVATGPVTISTSNSSAGYAIPQKAKDKGVHLDEDKISLLLKETEVSREVLGNAFRDSEEEEEKNEEIMPIDNSDSFNNLDDNHRALFEHIKEQESWSRKELISFCEGLQLMPDGAMETINEWAFDISAAPLISNTAEDIIYIDLEIVQEVTNDR